MAQVSKEVLKLDAIGVNDNFFELGGHSLLATRVVARLRNNFTIDLPLRKLFELPTIARLDEYMRELLHNQSGTITPPVAAVPRDRLIPASFSQQRLWFLREIDREATTYNVPAVFAIHGFLNVAVLEQALNALIKRHESLRTSFSVVEGSPVQHLLPTLNLPLPVSDLAGLPGEAKELEARRIALDEAHCPFDLHHGPLVRARLLLLGSENYFLLLNFDHAVVDGWSLGVLFRDLSILYDAVSKGRPSPLAPLPVQYADF